MIYKGYFLFVGRTGFEPATPWSQTTYSTGLNYLPFRLRKMECKYTARMVNNRLILNESGITSHALYSAVP